MLRPGGRTLLTLAALGFGASLLIDLDVLPGEAGVEDAAKLCGLGAYASWCLYFATELVRAGRDGP